MPYTVIANSTFLDAFGAVAVGPGDPGGLIATLQGNTGNDVSTAVNAIAPLLGPGSTLQAASSSDPDPVVNVAVMLNRSASPQTVSNLLGGDWYDRQSFITSQGSGIWSTYGADQTTYTDTTNAILQQLGIPVGSTQTPMSLAAAAGYVGNAADRTIWLSLTAAQFNTLFNSVLLEGDTLAWTGPLSLPDTISTTTIAGLWVESGVLFEQPVLAAGVSPNPPLPAAGPVSIGNSALIEPGEQWAPDVPTVDGAVYATPQAVAQHYNFPLPGTAATQPIALVETGLYQPNVLKYLNDYRQILGLPPLSEEQFKLMGATTIDGDGVELSIDISVISGAAPMSAQYLYGADSRSGTPAVTIFQAYQNAFFDTTNDPGILSSSWVEYLWMTPQSPFQAAWQQLFVDGMLSNVSVHIATQDEGSDANMLNGGANTYAGVTPAYALAVGGTSIATPWSALADPTLTDLYDRAMHGDRATVFELVEAGLTTMPFKLPQANPNTEMAGSTFAYAPTLTRLIETVWNEYSFVPDSSGYDLQVRFGQDASTGGGVDPTQPTPAYQAAFGLAPGTNPVSPNGSGRGIPDVSALAGGDAFYTLLSYFYEGRNPANTMDWYFGTSAAAPLWASLTAQFNVIFADHGLPPLGFYNDLLYIAAAVAPASFNDITRGNNNSGYFNASSHTGVVQVDAFGDSGYPIWATGVGLSAHEGYDLVTGLGTPNGLLLARALTQIAHEQKSFDDVVEFLSTDGSMGWEAGARESLLFQASTSSTAQVGLSLGTQSTSFASSASEDFAWTSRLAQQSLQRDFDPDLVKLFDGFSHGALFQANVQSGADIAVSIDGRGTVTPQAGITTAFGFADFTTNPRSTGFDPDVRVALPVAIAETAGGADDSVAIVRLRQNGENSLAISFFEVDDYTGAIDFGGRTVRPGDAGYAAAAQARAYQTAEGGTSIAGPGHGHFAQAALLDVDAGDIIAMKLANITTGAVFWSFANANETINGQPVAHLWNYGANTWGFEDTEGGGDRDFNDLVFGLDFVSTYGQAWLVQ